MTAFGLKADAMPAPQYLGIWPENWDALQVFRRMLTQLNMAPMGGIVGFRYEAIPVVMRACQVKGGQLPDLMDCLQHMERHMVKLLNARG